VLAGSLATACFPLMEKGGPQILMIALSSALNSAGYGVAFAGLSDVVPARQRGTVFGIVTAVYSMGGVIAPIATGALVGGAATKAIGYGHGFLLIGVLMAAGSIAAILLVDPERDARDLASRT
jgi:MFS family permease